MLEKPRRPLTRTRRTREPNAPSTTISDQGFPAQRVAVIGQDVCLIEQIISRMDSGRATLHGAASGALPGALIGWLYGLVLGGPARLRTARRPLPRDLRSDRGRAGRSAADTLRGRRRDDGEVWRPDRAGPAASDRGFAPVRSVQPSRYVIADAGGPQPAEQPYGLVGDRFVRTSRPYLNDRIRSVGAGRRIGRSSSWPRQWASTWAPPTR